MSILTGQQFDSNRSYVAGRAINCMDDLEKKNRISHYVLHQLIHHQEKKKTKTLSKDYCTDYSIPKGEKIAFQSSHQPKNLIQRG
ncbi:hypothetical protein YC2023_071321 [Brassica napus]